MRRDHGWRTAAALLASLCLALAVWAFWPASPIAVSTPRQAPASSTAAPAGPSAQTADTVERGRYLATLGNCQTCHTARGGTPYAGGRGMATPFGTVFSSNLTPSASGMGNWTADDFWRALHHGQSRDGRWLYPAFPYNNTTHIRRDDSDALYAYLQSLPPADTPVPPHEVAWPFNTQAALKVWRALYFETGETPHDPSPLTATRDEIARGAYLVRGLGHCSACHTQRNALGASHDMLGLAGGLMPVQNWYAPSLNDPTEAGVQDWSLADTVALFQTGRSGAALVTGPMAEVVQHSTQHWQAADLQAMARYLQQLPRRTATDRPAAAPTSQAQATLGAKVYERHCAQCHGAQGEGALDGQGHFAYPPLAGNRTVTQASPANLVQTVLNGGFAPATAGHPRPFGMPPFVLALQAEEVAAVLTHLRTHWGNRASAVSLLDVQQLRGSAH
jgi:mono/diheme cytochrome c family protein